jgi:hypothetical protein
MIRKLVARFWTLVSLWMEKIIAALTVVAVTAYGIHSIQVLLAMDWSATETFYEFINRTLIAVIGLELVRMLVNHSIGAVLELLAFVIARKMLKPDLTSLDIALSAAAFVGLMAARHFLMEEQFYRSKDDPASA